MLQHAIEVVHDAGVVAVDEDLCVALRKIDPHAPVRAARRVSVSAFVTVPVRPVAVGIRKAGCVSVPPSGIMNDRLEKLERRNRIRRNRIRHNRTRGQDSSLDSSKVGTDERRRSAAESFGAPVPCAVPARPTTTGPRRCARPRLCASAGAGKSGESSGGDPNSCENTLTGHMESSRVKYAAILPVRALFFWPDFAGAAGESGRVSRVGAT